MMSGPEQRRLVVVSGAPGTGKTTVARALAERLAVPMLSKDVIKDTLFDALGTGDVEWSKRLGGAAMEVLFRLAGELNEGVVEAFWRQPFAGDRLGGLSGRITEIHCCCPIELAKARFEQRAQAGARHPGHLDSERKDDASLWTSEAAGPLRLGGPLMMLDTSGALDISPVLDFVRVSATVALRKDPIRMVPYDSAWVVSFEFERARLASVLDPWLVRPVEHIGSTAVPGLVAKPIIDMVAVVDNIEAAAAAEVPLRAIGWVLAPEPTDYRERKLSFCRPSAELRTLHLHVVEERSMGWRGWLAFRDYLRTHPEAAQEYGELKTGLASEHGNDPNQRDAYRAGKADWVGSITTRALSGGM